MISLQLNIKKRLSRNSLIPCELTKKFLTGSQDRPTTLLSSITSIISAREVHTCRGLYQQQICHQQRVSSSTQNQAFNTVLFLFRNILEKETGDLGPTARAKRGQKLPVVFSANEVKSLFARMTRKKKIWDVSLRALR
jgi:site-specific recombinase XerD